MATDGTDPEDAAPSPAEAAALVRPTGGGPTLAEMARAVPVLLVFLRHFG
jgi:hypothetical protein